MIRRITLVAVPLVLSGSIAHAVTLFTPHVDIAPGQKNRCLVTNVGTTPAEVTVSLFDGDGKQVPPFADLCSAARPILAPLERCFVQAADGVEVACVIQSSSRNVRGALEVTENSNNHVVAVVPATAK